MMESNHASILSIFVKMLRKSIYSLLLNAKDVILSIYHILEVFFMIPILIDYSIPILSIYLCSRQQMRPLSIRDYVRPSFHCPSIPFIVWPIIVQLSVHTSNHPFVRPSFQSVSNVRDHESKMVQNEEFCFLVGLHHLHGQ